MLFSARRVVSVFTLLVLWASQSQAQIAIDLSVDISESDGIYTYVYTLENTEFSFQGINTFFLTTGKRAVIDEITGPDNWFADYAIDETAGLQASFLTGISEDGLRCGASNDFDIEPGEKETFTIKSPWAPEEKDYSIGRTIFDDESPCFFDGEDLVGVIASPSIAPSFEPCDFDGDGDCDTRDIDNLALTITFGDNEPKFDLTGDSLVTLADLDEFLEQVNRINGDADLNGKVEFADFLVLSGNFGQADLGWSDGDFDADGKVAFADFLIQSGNFGQGEVAAAAVPEPTSLGLLSIALLGGCMSVRRRRCG